MPAEMDGSLLEGRKPRQGWTMFDPAAATGIPWQPIATMPTDRKDGREMLIWVPSLLNGNGLLAAHWVDGPTPHWSVKWSEIGEVDPTLVTFYADINPPE